MFRSLPALRSPAPHRPAGRAARAALAFVLALLIGTGGALLPAAAAPATASPATPSQSTKFTSGPPKSTAKRDKLGRYVSSPTTNGKPAPTPWAASWVLGSLDTGDIYAQHKPNDRLWPASVMKLLTGLALVDQFPNRRAKYTATKQCEEVDGTAVGLERSHRYTIDELFHAMLMMSANDAAYALADAAGGQQKALALMNKKAKQIGMTGTVAKTPNGLDAKGQTMTTHDLMVLAKHFTQNAYLMKVVGTPTYKFDTGMSAKQKAAQKKKAKAAKKSGRKFTKTPSWYEIANHTKIAGQVPGGLGLKNGYTIKARGSFVAVVKRGGKTYIAALLGSTDQPRQPAIDMIDWAFNQKSPKKAGHIDFAAIDTTPQKPAVRAVPTGTAVTTEQARARQGATLSDSAALWGGGILLVIVVLGIGLIIGKRAKRAHHDDY